MKPLAEIVHRIEDAEEFARNFADLDHFSHYIAGSAINDLKQLLRVYERAEMYRHCQVIQYAIDCRVDEMLSGFGFE